MTERSDSEVASHAISGHKGRDRWMCTLAAASDLSTMAIRLALRLCVSFNCKTGQCDPGYRTLAEDMAVSERSVFRAIAELEAGGWIAVDRTGGDNTRNNQFALHIPSAQVTTVVTRSGDNMVSPEKVSVQVTENGGSGDKNRGVQVTHSVSPLKNLKPENLKRAAKPPPRSADDVRESVETHSANTPDDETSNQRAAEAALIDTVAAQNQNPSRDNPTGTATNGADGDPAYAPVYQRGREVLGADADAVTAKLLSAYDGDAESALDTLACAEEESDPRQYVERDIDAAALRQGSEHAVHHKRPKRSGSRPFETLPSDWRPSSTDKDYARSRRGWDDDQIGLVAEKFVLHFHAKLPIAKVADQWRKWVLNERDDPQASQGRKISGAII